MAYDFFYDAQIRRFLVQVVRAFSGFQYQVAGRNGEPPQLQVVPCRMATQNRQVGHILKNNSENTLLSVPLITVFIKQMQINRERTQAPGHTSTVTVEEREIVNGAYTENKGKSYTVERMIPHPLDIDIQVDVWTSNEMQKHQLFEQIYSTFNVGFDIQSSENPIDWTALTTLRLDNMTWSSKSVPVGTNDEIDIMSFVFQLPIWINPPAKVKQQRLINQIVTNILDGEVDTEDGDSPDGSLTGIIGGDLMTQLIVTPDNAQIEVSGNEITLLNSKGEVDETNPLKWADYLQPYGKLIPAQSQLRLRSDLEQDLSLDIVGTIQIDTNRPNVLLWQVDIDTLPSNTVLPIKAIIDPLKNLPSSLPELPAEGHRYLILSDIGPSQVWGQITAKVGDIIEYRSHKWQVLFDAATTTGIQYVVNLRTGKQLKFENGSWIMAIDGTYNAGQWRLKL